MPKKSAKMKKSLVLLAAINPLFGRLQVPVNPILGTLSITSAEKEVVGAAAAHEQPQKSFLHC